MKTILKSILTIFIIFSYSQLFAQEKTEIDLFKAIETNNHSMIKILVEKDSIDINSSRSYSRMLSSNRVHAIHHALRYGSAATIDFLLELGADPTLTEYQSGILSGVSTTSLEVLTESRGVAFIKTFIFKLKVDPESYTKALLKASEIKSEAKVKYLLSVGEKILIPE